ncbi:MAG: hypothetical protein ABUL58_04215, partial [Steroidobacter sp.]
MQKLAVHVRVDNLHCTSRLIMRYRAAVLSLLFALMFMTSGASSAQFVTGQRSDTSLLRAPIVESPNYPEANRRQQ